MLSQLINGRANIWNDLAKKLSVMLGTSVEVVGLPCTRDIKEKIAYLCSFFQGGRS